MATGVFTNLFHRADRLQKSFMFKVIASALVVLLAIGISVTYMVRLETKRSETRARQEAMAADLRAELEGADEAPGAAPPADAAAKKQAELERAYRKAELTYAEANQRAIAKLVNSETDPTVVLVGAAAITGILLTVVWLGLGLTGLAILAFLAALAYPLNRFGNPTWRDIGRFIAGVGCLSFSFVVLMQLLRLAFSGPNAVLAIARNVVNEAVRIKVSLVFIVLLLFAMAALPGLLDPNTPLRYRVQTFLQYGSGGSFWIIAILVLFLSVSSVAFEQRDRVIWQTMTKPVASWQYVLGKWLGVVGVAAVLLMVSATGVFLFTEYLRDQKAYGESAPYQPIDETGQLSEDRFVLESQILTARESVKPDLPDLDPAKVAEEIKARAAKKKASDENYEFTPEEEAKLYKEYEQEVRTSYFAIEGGQQERYQFSGLKDAKDRDAAITLRYKVDIGANDPKQLHHLTFMMQNMPAPVVKEIPLGQSMQMPVSPASIDADGNLVLMVLNGDVRKYQAGDTNWATHDTMSFPPDGLEIIYSVGSYQANFLRVVVVQWLKIAMLAMVGILAATFLSFSVACLVAFGTFLIAETSGYLFDALEYFASTDQKGNIMVHRVIIRAIAVPVSRAFRFYSQLRPAEALVDGHLIGWSRVLLTIGIVGGVTVILYLTAVAIFRRRELATYSGQ